MNFKKSNLSLLLIVLCLVSTSPARSAEVGKIVQSLGHALQAGQPAHAGDTVQEGSTLSTGADGYLYIKTLDNGFFILRPNTTATIPVYQVNASQPDQSRFKIELQSGVLRSISGQAVKQARQNYRLNTPLAAIGVRGTDFTVFTNDSATRVAVTAGGVVVSGFGLGCSAAGSGPCENAAVQELFAEQAGQILQVLRGTVAPQRLRDTTLAPDAAAPPRKDEPLGALAFNTTAVTPPPLKLASLPHPTVPVPPTPPVLQWGRWQPLADQGINFTLPQAMAAGQLVALNSYFALLRGPHAGWQPAQALGTASFVLQTAQAQVVNPSTGLGMPASLVNATLALDFAQNRFATQFDLVSAGLRLPLQAQGQVAPDGSFGNISQFLGSNNMLVQGALANTTSLQAGYLFQSRLDATHTASGVTYWTK
ncbi:FecR family protein [Rhodoferax sp.]|uniref:FecR family protein n=1 Tax=Rhodoferax sp. TaxID=50421 RepID=UPI0026209AD6|nr:FecR family protein [Rhodoferax sp.]MDD2809715.1 FecR family protein [Rhodoferax sp.]MDD4943896.1 FecR family protein [Rhodoferax sp.]